MGCTTAVLVGDSASVAFFSYLLGPFQRHLWLWGGFRVRAGGSGGAWGAFLGGSDSAPWQDVALGWLQHSSDSDFPSGQEKLMGFVGKTKEIFPDAEGNTFSAISGVFFTNK